VLVLGQAQALALVLEPGPRSPRQLIYQVTK